MITSLFSVDSVQKVVVVRNHPNRKINFVCNDGILSQKSLVNLKYDHDSKNGLKHHYDCMLALVIHWLPGLQ